jgi:hypothetical protein
MNDLEKYFANNTQNLIHKWNHYFEICFDQPGRSRPMDDRRKPGETPVALLGTR